MSILQKVFWSLMVMTLVACNAEEVPSKTNNLTAEAISVSKAYVRAVPEGQENSAAFMVLSNNSDKARVLVQVDSRAAKAVELHTNTQVNGMMRMQRLEKIEIPANGESELKPGGKHVMLINLTQPLIAGQSIELTLQFDDKNTITLEVPIVEIGSEM